MYNPLLWLVIAMGVGVLAVNGFFYQTGDQWYQACWQKLYATEGKEPKPTTPEQASAWMQCGHLAEKVTYDEGMLFTSRMWGNDNEYAHDKNKAVLLNCPSDLRDTPSGGWYIYFVKAIEARGGVSLLDKLLPAGNMLKQIVTAKWPKCNAARQSLGYPKIVWKEGKWDWSAPCVPCNTHNQEARQ